MSYLKTNDMFTIDRGKYTLLLSKNPCELFAYYGVEEMHGLNLYDCIAHPNTSRSSYICGLCNYVPKPIGEPYRRGDAKFVYINLNRCNSDVETFGHIFHELTHMGFELYEDEEEIITFAELEAVEVFPIVKTYVHVVKVNPN